MSNATLDIILYTLDTKRFLFCLFLFLFLFCFVFLSLLYKKRTEDLIETAAVERMPK